MLDVRGLNCPMPVLAVQREVKANKPEALEVLANHMTAVQNITRFGPLSMEFSRQEYWSG